MTEYNIRLNPNCASVVRTGLKFKSGDKGITFVIAVDELDTTDTTAKIVFQRANGTSVESDITESDGMYSYKTLGNEFAVPGKTIADVKFYASEDRVSTASFVFEVIGDTMDGLGAGVGGYSDRLEQLVAEAEAAGALIEQAKVELETAEDNMKATEAEMAEVLLDFKNQYATVGALNPRGDWNSTTSYQIRDVVFYNGLSWTCMVANTGVVPSEENASIWSKHTDLEKIEQKIDSIQTTSQTTLSTAGWYRVAEYAPSSSDYLMGKTNNGCRITINRPTYNSHGEEYTLELFTRVGLQEFKPYKCVASIHYFTKARYTSDGTKDYIEIYYAGSASNPLVATVNSYMDFRKAYWKAITPTLTEENIDGVTVTTVYDIPSSASPVTDLELVRFEGGEILTTSVLEKAISLTDSGIYNYRIGTAVAEDGFPSGYTAQCVVTIIKSYTYVNVINWGRYAAGMHMPIINRYDPGSATWAGWIKFASVDDLATELSRHLKKSGSQTLDGNLTIYASDASARILAVETSMRRISNYVKESGEYQLRDVTNNKNIITSFADGTTTFGGTATGNLVKTSPTIQATGGDYGGQLFFQLGANSNLNTGIRVENYLNLFRIMEVGGNARGAYIDLSACANGGTTAIFHEGNSAPVAISATAPEVTNALWYDTVNKIVKRYVDGAWQA